MNDPFSNLNFGKSMSRNFCQKPIFEKNENLQNVGKFNINFAKNQGKFLIFGKCMGPILGQYLVNVWVTFHFPSSASLPKKILSTPPGPKCFCIVILCSDIGFCQFKVLATHYSYFENIWFSYIHLHLHQG